MTTAARILWRGAGQPRSADEEPHQGSCWWCGLDCGGAGRPVKGALARTFPDRILAARPGATHLCPACGWTLNDKVALPPKMGQARIRMKARVGRRATVMVRGLPPKRWLILELDDGAVGLWTCGPNAVAEKPWMAAVSDLRAAPRGVGPCEYVESVHYDDLDPGPVEKFRCFHHLGTATTWIPCTDTDRMMIRAYLLNPPTEPWVGSIGDGKKHTLIYSEPSPGALSIGSRPNVARGQQASLFAARRRPITTLQRVFYRGAMVDYLPAELSAAIEAIEDLVRAGARDEEIESGRYSPRPGLAWVIRSSEAVLAPIRQTPTLDLCLYLRRNTKELRNDA